MGIAKSMGIDVDCSLLLPYPCCLRDIDICIILSNALDNAIQAVKRLDAGMEKYIHVSGRIQGDFLMMEIENSFHGKGAFKKGTGLSNVNAVAEKYGGAMSIETQENKFVLHVLLIIWDTDTVSISESGKAALDGKTDSVQTGADNGISAEETADAIKMESVIYTKTGEASKSESDTNISVSV